MGGACVLEGGATQDRQLVLHPIYVSIRISGAPAFAEVAAVLAASVELGGLILLAIGVTGRFAATALSVLNFVAAISYSDLSPAGRTEHLYWGFLLLSLIFHGPGKISIDHLIRRKMWVADNIGNDVSKIFVSNSALPSTK